MESDAVSYHMSFGYVTIKPSAKDYGHQILVLLQSNPALVAPIKVSGMER